MLQMLAKVLTGFMRDVDLWFKDLTSETMEQKTFGLLEPECESAY
jgi:hypothetical protein